MARRSLRGHRSSACMPRRSPAPRQRPLEDRASARWATRPLARKVVGVRIDRNGENDMDASTFAVATMNAHRAAEQQRELRLLAAQRERRAHAAAPDGRAASAVTEPAAAYGLAGPAR